MRRQVLKDVIASDAWRQGYVFVWVLRHFGSPDLSVPPTGTLNRIWVIQRYLSSAVGFARAHFIAVPMQAMVPGPDFLETLVRPDDEINESVKTAAGSPTITCAGNLS